MDPSDDAMGFAATPAPVSSFTPEPSAFTARIRPPRAVRITPVATGLSVVPAEASPVVVRTHENARTTSLGSQRCLTLDPIVLRLMLIGSNARDKGRTRDLTLAHPGALKQERWRP
jgi:hypothetical protein